MLVMVVLICGMVVPVEQCTPETAILVSERTKFAPVDCAYDELSGQSSAQVQASGTYEKHVCRYAQKYRWRPGMNE